MRKSYPQSKHCKNKISEKRKGKYIVNTSHFEETGRVTIVKADGARGCDLKGELLTKAEALRVAEEFVQNYYESLEHEKRKEKKSNVIPVDEINDRRLNIDIAKHDIREIFADLLHLIDNSTMLNKVEYNGKIYDKTTTGRQKIKINDIDSVKYIFKYNRNAEQLLNSLKEKDVEDGGFYNRKLIDKIRERRISNVFILTDADIILANKSIIYDNTDTYDMRENGGEEFPINLGFNDRFRIKQVDGKISMAALIDAYYRIKANKTDHWYELLMSDSIVVGGRFERNSGKKPMNNYYHIDVTFDYGS